MTREEAINELEILKENYWDDDGYGHETKQYDDTMLALDMAIKALEQEPTDNDVVLTYDMYHELIADRAEKLEQESILDKIRAEIEQLSTTKCTETRRIYIDADDFKENVLAILDKYKADRSEEV